jgi:chromosome segregation ATPase
LGVILTEALATQVTDESSDPSESPDVGNILPSAIAQFDQKSVTLPATLLNVLLQPTQLATCDTEHASATEPKPVALAADTFGQDQNQNQHEDQDQDQLEGSSLNTSADSTVHTALSTSHVSDTSDSLRVDLENTKAETLSLKTQLAAAIQTATELKSQSSAAGMRVLEAITTSANHEKHARQVEGELSTVNAAFERSQQERNEAVGERDKLSTELLHTKSLLEQHTERHQTTVSELQSQLSQLQTEVAMITESEAREKLVRENTDKKNLHLQEALDAVSVQRTIGS